MSVIQMARFMETARQRIENTNGSLLKNSSRQFAQSWLDHTDNAAIKEAVRFASARTGLDDQTILDTAEASLRYRVLAGLIHMKMTIPEEEPRGCICANQQYDEKTDSWPCKVSGNQAQADEWHEAFGNGPACPYWEDPSPIDQSDTELDKMLNEGEDLFEAWRQLGIIGPAERLRDTRD